MIYVSEIEEVLSRWENICKTDNNPEYLIGIKECLSDMQNLISEHYKKEAEEDYADSFLSSMEAFERN